MVIVTSIGICITLHADETKKHQYTDDDIVDDMLIVYIESEYNKLFTEWTPKDFPEIEIEEIYSRLKDPNKEYPDNYWDDYNELVYIKLANKDKESILEAIRILQENPVVCAVYPNSYAYPDDSFVEMQQIYGTDIYWYFEAETLTLYIEGDGEIPGYYFEGVGPDEPVHITPWIEYAGNVKEIKISEGITGIGAYCFYEFENLEKIYFPKTINYIGDIFPREKENSFKLSLMGYPLTVTEIVSVEKGFKFIPCLQIKKGDMDGNDILNAEDALNILKIAAKLSENYAYTADINEDNIVNAEDALQILKSVAKIG